MGCDVLEAEASNWRRLSSLGRNFSGVWSTEATDDGGLKMIWSCLGDSLEERKDDAGAIFSAILVRR